MKNIFLLLFFLCGFLFADQQTQELLELRKRGDFFNEARLRKEMEDALGTVGDSTLLTRLKRNLYMELIPLPQEIFYDSNVSALTADKDDLWVGSRSGDIARYSLSERQWVSFFQGEETLAIRTVQSIQANSETVWILSYGSVAVYSKRHNSFVPLNIPDTGIFRGLQSALIMGSGLICGTQGTGLRRIRLDGYSLISQEPELRNITFLKKLKEDALLAGTEEDGLFILDHQYQPRPLTLNNRQSSGVRVVLDQGTDRMIAGTYGSGLFLLVKKDGKYDIVFLGSRAKWITGGVEIPGFFCFSTLGEGLVILDKTSLDPTYYGISEGLSGLDISSIAYVEPYVICAVQGQGLVRIHENYFKEP